MFGPTYLSYNMEEAGVQFHETDSIGWRYLLTTFVGIRFYSTAKRNSLACNATEILSYG
jgi:hypothetical protein